MINRFIYNIRIVKMVMIIYLGVGCQVSVANISFP